MTEDLSLKITFCIKECRENTGTEKRIAAETKTPEVRPALKNPRKGVRTFSDAETVLLRIVVNSGVMKYYEAAELFGVSPTTIWRLVHFDTYRGVE